MEKIFVVVVAFSLNLRGVLAKHSSGGCSNQVRTSGRVMGGRERDLRKACAKRAMEEIPSSVFKPPDSHIQEGWTASPSIQPETPECFYEEPALQAF